MAAGVFSIHGDGQTVSTAITILEVTAPSTGSLELIEAWLGQTGVTSVTMARIRILRKATTITGGASPPSAVPDEGSPAFGGTIKWLATAEGSDGNVERDEPFNYLNGWRWYPVDVFGRDRIWVPPSGIIALKFPVAPTSASFSFGMKVVEHG